MLFIPLTGSPPWGIALITIHGRGVTMPNIPRFDLRTWQQSFKQHEWLMSQAARGNALNQAFMRSQNRLDFYRQQWFSVGPNRWTRLSDPLNQISVANFSWGNGLGGFGSMSQTSALSQMRIGSSFDLFRQQSRFNQMGGLGSMSQTGALSQMRMGSSFDLFRQQSRFNQMSRWQSSYTSSTRFQRVGMTSSFSMRNNRISGQQLDRMNWLEHRNKMLGQFQRQVRGDVGWNLGILVAAPGSSLASVPLSASVFRNAAGAVLTADQLMSYSSRAMSLTRQTSIRYSFSRPYYGPKGY